MTKNGFFHSTLSDALRRSGGFAPFAYYTYYFTAPAETD